MQHPTATRGLFVALAAAILVPAAPAFGSGAHFVANDLYLANLSLPVSNVHGIVRISPSTWTSTPLITFAAGEVPQFSGRFAYDPFRDRLVLPDSTTALTLIDANGARTPLPYTWAQTASLLAPTGDGRIYMNAFGFGVGTPSFAYIDAAGAAHPLLGASGAAPYSAINFAIEGMIYDQPTNSLIIANCVTPNMRLQRLSLSADGSRIVNDSLVVNAFVTADDPHVMSLSRGPSGSIMAKIDDNSNATLGRMIMINTAALTTSVWALSGYQGVGGETAGCFCAGAASPAVIVLDTLTDHLRGYVQGASGAGSLLPTTGVSASTGSGDRAQLLAIDGHACPGDANGDNHVDFIDLNIVLSNFGGVGAALPGDFDHDGDVDFVDLNVVLSAFGGVC